MKQQNLTICEVLLFSARATAPDQNSHSRGKSPYFLYDETTVVPDGSVERLEIKPCFNLFWYVKILRQYLSQLFCFQGIFLNRKFYW